MARLKGFSDEDYRLAQDIDQAVGVQLGTTVPSRACDAAETWALIKLRKRAKKLWDAGWHEQSKALYNTCDLLQSGEL